MSQFLSLWHGLIDKPPAKRSMREIATEVAESYELPMTALVGYTRNHASAWVRQEAMHACRAEGHSYSAIGRFFKRDHSTVIYGVMRHKARISSLPDFAQGSLQA